jgi:hypothetical protein
VSLFFISGVDLLTSNKFLKSVAMRLLFLFALFLLGTSELLAQQKSATVISNNVRSATLPRPAAAPHVFRGVSGTIRTASCATYIEVIDNGAVKRIFPVNLSREFHQDGKTIVFDFVEEDVNYPEGCGILQSVRLNNIQIRTH